MRWSIWTDWTLTGNSPRTTAKPTSQACLISRNQVRWAIKITPIPSSASVVMSTCTRLQSRSGRTQRNWSFWGSASLCSTNSWKIVSFYWSSPSAATMPSPSRMHWPATGNSAILPLVLLTPPIDSWQMNPPRPCQSTKSVTLSWFKWQGSSKQSLSRKRHWGSFRLPFICWPCSTSAIGSLNSRNTMMREQLRCQTTRSSWREYRWARGFKKICENSFWNSSRSLIKLSKLPFYLNMNKFKGWRRRRKRPLIPWGSIWIITKLKVWVKKWRLSLNSWLILKDQFLR